MRARTVTARLWALAATLLVAAWFVALGTPDRDAATAPFTVTAQLGQEASGRNIAVTVDQVRLATEGVSDGSGWSAGGTWLVVDLSAQATVTEVAANLSYARLHLGADLYQASERPRSLARSPLAVDIPRSGTLAFEVPPEAVTGRAVLTLGLSVDPRLDSVIELPIDLDTVPREAEIAWERPDWTKR